MVNALYTVSFISGEKPELEEPQSLIMFSKTTCPLLWRETPFVFQGYKWIYLLQKKALFLPFTAICYISTKDISEQRTVSDSLTIYAENEEA